MLQHGRKYAIRGSKIIVESCQILLTLRLSVKRLRRFDLPSACSADLIKHISEWCLQIFYIISPLPEIGLNIVPTLVELLVCREGACDENHGINEMYNCICS